MNHSDLRDLLEPFGISPVHDRGQHFLLNDDVVDQMVAAADVKAGERVLEIGPGPGILTEKLLATGADVTAVELDLKLQQLLAHRFGAQEHFHLIAGDVLQFANDALASKPYKVVANLPYGITTKVLTKFLLEEPVAKSITVMIQREVADRILAKPNDMSALTVLVQAYADVSRVTNVPAGAFYPPPKVDSAVIHISRKSDVALAEFFQDLSPEAFFDLVRTAFADRRKQLKNTLRARAASDSALSSAFLKAGVDGTRRPETLRLEEWRALAFALTL